MLFVALLAILTALSDGAGAGSTAHQSEPARQQQGQVVPLDAADTAAGGVPIVGQQDGWIERPGNQGCAGGWSTGPPRYTSRAVPPAVVDPKYWALIGAHTRTIRITIPWDIAWHHDPTAADNHYLDIYQACFNYWLSLLHQHNAVALVQFRPDYYYKKHKPGVGTVLEAPSIRNYQRAMKAFLRRYSCTTPHGGWVSTCKRPNPPGGVMAYPTGAGEPGAQMSRVSVIEPWGEPDATVDMYMPNGRRRMWYTDCHHGVNECGPVLAAHMFVDVASHCRHCKVVAGTFSSWAGLDPWTTLNNTYLGIYAHNLEGRHPKYWALDPYTDISTFEDHCMVQPVPHTINGGTPAQAGLPPHNAVCGNPWAPCNTVSSGQLFNSGTYSLTCRYSLALHMLGYGSHTYIWMGEISAFNIGFLGCGGSSSCPWYGYDVEGQAMKYLINHLAHAGSETHAGYPWVTRLYYMRYNDGAGFRKWSLILPNPTGATIKGIPPGKYYQTPAYCEEKHIITGTGCTPGIY